MVVGETGFLNDTKGTSSGDMLHRYNTSNEYDCAGNCVRNAECEAFKYVSNSTTDFNCEIFASIKWYGTRESAKLIRLSFPAQGNYRANYNKWERKDNVTKDS